jgi:outer membrane lipoprotein-sorting protein
MNKKIMNKSIFVLLVLLLLVSTGSVLAAPRVEDILKEIEQITELEADGTAKVDITQQKAGEGVKVYKSIYYRRDEDDSFLIVFTEPEVEKGNGYLRVGDNFWMYRRNTRTFQHITRDESIAGTDASGGDFENKKLTEMYKPVVDENGNEIIKEATLGNIPVYEFELEAKIEDVSYPEVVYWVRQDNYLPLKIQSYSLNGTLMMTSYFLKYTIIQDKYLCIKSMYVDEFEEGNKTLVEIKEISIQEIDDHVFTKAYLESLSK